jgi:hypothetical protein
MTLAAMDRSAQFQRTFAAAIFSDHAPVPATIRSGTGSAHVTRFGVYRNNVIAGLIKAIAARYPVVRRLLWEDAFNRVARLYVMTDPPRSPALFEYGETFPQFIRNVGEGTSAYYLADVAELEAARTRAYHAANATPLSRDAFKALAPEHMPNLRFTLHPSMQLLKSRFPVVSIWEANLHANDNALSLWQPECSLIARPRLEVEVRRLTAGVHQFLSALAEGCTLGAAMVRGINNAPHFDLTECLGTLVSADVIVGLESS